MKLEIPIEAAFPDSELERVRKHAIASLQCAAKIALDELQRRENLTTMESHACEMLRAAIKISDAAYDNNENTFQK